MNKKLGLIEPASSCEACGERFYGNDQCVVMVHVPSLHTQTVCVVCYGLMLAAAIEHIQGNPPMDVKHAFRVLAAFAANDNAENGPGVH